jgi:hypothetical protein
MNISEYIARDFWGWHHEKPRHFPTLNVTFNLEGLTEAGKATALAALDTWEPYMDFTRVSHGDADIIFDDDGWVAESDSVTSHGLIAQSTVNVPVSYQYQMFAYVHEIGHAIGLGHPGPYNASGTSGMFPDDNWGHSVMSYFSGGASPPSSPKEYDIAAWHLIYDGAINVPTFDPPTNRMTGGADVNRGVDTDWYNGANLDVWSAHVDPAAHYSAYGWREGRDPNAYFDTDWYLEQYADVDAAAVNPLDHYREFGWREGRDPSETFDTSAYLQANPDVAQAQVNPLEHYLVFGISEGRPAWLV